MTNLPKQTQASTDGLTPKEAKAYWRENIAELCHGLQLEFPKKNLEFKGYIDGIPFGPAMLFNFKIDEHTAQRLPHHIARDHIDCFSFSFVRNGSLSISGKFDTISMKDNSIYLLDVGESFLMKIGQRLDMTTIFFDKTWLSSIIPAPEKLLWRDLSAESGWGRALAAVMTEIAPDRVDNLGLPAHCVVDQIAALLALAAGPVDSLKSGQRTVLKRLRRDMQDRLHDPTLDPALFSSQHGISRRTLHALFASADSSFMKELIAMRLERAMSLLSDRRFLSKTIAEIATLVGFVNANHFSIRFRQAYGRSPTDVRPPAVRACIPQRTDSHGGKKTKTANDSIPPPSQ